MRIKCTGFITDDFVKNFTVGKIYEWNNGLVDDKGNRWETGVRGEDINKWDLSDYVKFEKFKDGDTKNWKAVIIPDKDNPEKTVMRYYEDGEIVREESVKRYHEDTYNAIDAIKAVVNKTFPETEPKTENTETSRLKYKAGDKVVVKRNLEEHEVYGTHIAIDSMVKLRGEVVVIRSPSLVKTGYYVVGSPYIWTDEMFEGFAPKYYNGKIICTQSENRYFTKGKTYEVKNGITIDDTGFSYHISPLATFDDLSRNISLASFIEAVE